MSEVLPSDDQNQPPHQKRLPESQLAGSLTVQPQSLAPCRRHGGSWRFWTALVVMLQVAAIF
jgi:hypothetical protein